MRGIWRLVGLLALAPFGAGCGDRPAQAALRPVAAPLIWHDVGTWSGHGSRQTGSFDVTSGTLRVTWEARDTGAPGAGRLRVDLHSAISGRPLQTVVDVRGTGKDTAYVADEPRVSYLRIDADGVDWTLRVEEASASARP